MVLRRQHRWDLSLRSELLVLLLLSKEHLFAHATAGLVAQANVLLLLEHELLVHIDQLVKLRLHLALVSTAVLSLSDAYLLLVAIGWGSTVLERCGELGLVRVLSLRVTIDIRHTGQLGNTTSVKHSKVILTLIVAHSLSNEGLLAVALRTLTVIVILLHMGLIVLIGLSLLSNRNVGRRRLILLIRLLLAQNMAWDSDHALPLVVLSSCIVSSLDGQTTLSSTNIIRD